VSGAKDFLDGRGKCRGPVVPARYDVGCIVDHNRTRTPHISI